MKTKFALFSLLLSSTFILSGASSYFQANAIASSATLNKTLDHQLRDDEMSGQEFIDELNALNSGDVYTLTKDVDLSDLTMSDDIDLLEDVTIEGNYHRIHDRSLDDAINLTTLYRGVYLFDNLKESTVNNLVFDNVPFVFKNIQTSTLNNVNFINTEITNKTFNTTMTRIFNEATVLVDSAGIGFFAQRFANSSWTNSVIQNLSFHDNIVNNKTNSSNVGTIFMAPIAFVSETKTDIITNTASNEFENIFVDNLNYENNQFEGAALSSQVNTSFNYGNASSIYFSPLFAASLGYKTNDSYAKININNFVVNNLNYLNNGSTITNNTINTNGRGQGIFYSINPAFILGTQMTMENSYLFNINTFNEDDTTLINTGYVNTLNNYGDPSKGYITTNLAYYYQDKTFRKYNGFDSVLYKYIDYQSMIDSIKIDDTSTRNDALSWNGNLWEIKKTTSNQDPSLYMHYAFWFADSKVTYDAQKILYSGVFKTGNFASGTWDVNLATNNTSLNDSLVSNESVREVFVTKIVLDPTSDLTMTFSQGDIAWRTLIDTSYLIPKISNVYNNVVNGKLQLSIDFINNFGYDLKFDIKLYNKNDLVEKFEKQLIAPNASTNSQIFTSIANFDANKNYDDYYFDVYIDFKTSETEWSNIYDDIIHFDETSLIGYRHYEAPTNLLLVALILLLILFLIIVAIIIILILRRRAKTTKMIALYEEVTGIAEFENY